jgi:hypothetical protein
MPTGLTARKYLPFIPACYILALFLEVRAHGDNALIPSAPQPDPGEPP